jgi:hypothetical protein
VRLQGDLGPLGAERCGFPNEEENHMMNLLSRDGLRQDESAICPGAQTERRGAAGPVRDLLDRETSPAASFSHGDRFDVR